MSAGGRTIAVEIGPDPPARLDKALARDVPEGAELSRSRLVRLIEEGCVLKDGAVLDSPKTRVAAGDRLEIQVPEPADVALVPEAIPLDVVHEDADLIVVNKAAGMVVHPAPGSPSGTLVNALLHHFGGALSGVGGEKRPGIVHRIDKDTSGLLVVAKSDAAHHGLAAQFEAHSVARRYLALCHGVPEASDPRLGGLRGIGWEGNTLRIATELARHKTDRQRQAVVWSGGRRAVTRARVIDRYGTPAAIAQVECWLETGRTHQIRVHLAYAGHGLLGDPVYGGARRGLSAKSLGDRAVEAARAFSRQALHAASLGFEHPVSGESLRFEAPVPGDLEKLLYTLSSSAT